VLLASEDWARARNLPVQAWLTYGKSWAVDFAGGRDGLLMAPAYAVPAMLDDAQASRCRTSTSTRSTRPSPRRCCAR
jgi:hypothetical protein